MSDLLAVLNRAEQLIRQGQDGLLATVVKTEGSAYRRAGARLLVDRQGGRVGGISGGCLEGDILKKGWWRTERGPTLVTYDSTGTEETAWRSGGGCNGIVQVLLQRISPSGDSALSFIRDCFDHGRTGILATVFFADPQTSINCGDQAHFDKVKGWGARFESHALNDCFQIDVAEQLKLKRSRTFTYSVAGGSVDIFSEVVQPPIQLAIFGGGFDVSPVVQAARALGWSVACIARRPQKGFDAEQVVVTPAKMACAHMRLNDRTAAVVMNHNFEEDRDAIAMLLGSDVRYIGILGPRDRTEQILAEVDASLALDRIYAPIGLDVGAETPEEIAASIIGQIIAVFSGHPGGHLRDRTGPIHLQEESCLMEELCE
ncbi:MAG: XdhC family protein [Gemmataceae bacterium]